MSTAVGERYAQALIEVGEESGTLAQLTEQVGRFHEAYAGSAELRNALSNPVFSESVRDELVRAVAARLGLASLATNAMRLIAKRRRLPNLGDITRQLAFMADQRTGVVRAKVITAKQLPETFYSRLSEEIAQATSRSVKLERHVDASLIAGVITTIGDNTIDGSLRGRLQDVEQRLTQAG